MKCEQAKPLFSSYLDGDVPGNRMSALSAHLESCADCAADYGKLRQTQSLVASLGRRQAPPELALQLRIALSREASRTWRRRVEGFVARAEDSINAIMFPAAAGLVSAVLIFGVLMGVFAPIATAEDDMPTMLYTPPKLSASPFENSLSPVNSDTITVDTLVGANGRVQDYRIISGQDDTEVRTKLNEVLIFTTFEPAMSFGRPVPGRVLVSFSRIKVRG